MELDIFWTRFAENKLHKIFKYYHENASYHIAVKLVYGIYKKTTKLKKHPEIGQIEELLKDRKQVFRYLIYKRNFKIIYWINRKDNHIEVVDVFDVRQYPLKIRRAKK